MKKSEKTLIIVIAICACSAVAFIVFGFALYSTKLTKNIEEIAKYTKPEELKTIADRNRLIEETKEEVREMATDRWLKVSDIIAAKRHFWSGDTHIDKKDWLKLLEKSEESPMGFTIYEPSETEYRDVSVTFEISSKEVIKALAEAEKTKKEPNEPEEAEWKITFEE